MCVQFLRPNWSWKRPFTLDMCTCGDKVLSFQNTKIMALAIYSNRFERCAHKTIKESNFEPKTFNSGWALLAPSYIVKMLYALFIYVSISVGECEDECGWWSKEIKRAQANGALRDGVIVFVIGVLCFRMDGHIVPNVLECYLLFFVVVVGKVFYGMNQVSYAWDTICVKRMCKNLSHFYEKWKKRMYKTNKYN